MGTFLIAGQSYAANSNDKRLFVHDRRITAWHMDMERWIVADDPQPQNGGDAYDPCRIAEWGSIWPAFADAIQPAFTEPVRLVTTSIWSEPLSFWLSAPNALDRIVAGVQLVEGSAPILWQQGESDVIAHTSRATYVSQFRELRSRVAARTGYKPTWILALSTYHPTAYNDPVAEGEIRAALMESAQDPDCLLGPDTDQLKGAYRSPVGHSQHWSESGQYAAAQLWCESVLAHRDKIIMTDPQDKAAIASLQKTVSEIMAALNNTTAALNMINVRLASLQRTDTNLGTNISALQAVTRDGPIGPYGNGVYSGGP